RLHTETLAIERVETSGTPPGWIGRHKARLLPPGNRIEITGGNVSRATDDLQEPFEENHRVFQLDLALMEWSETPSDPGV
ncbi:MAG: hypothetical protein ACRCZF_10550, partial [Gemmataceae bacterium]